MVDNGATVRSGFELKAVSRGQCPSSVRKERASVVGYQSALP